MYEADTGIQLRVPRQTLLQTGHADQDHSDLVTIVEGLWQRFLHF
jgi:hypothetical protein